MVGFSRLTHRGRVTNVVGRQVDPAITRRDAVRDDVNVDGFRIDEVGHPELPAPFLAVGIDGNPDDHVRARHSLAWTAIAGLQHVPHLSDRAVNDGDH